MAEHFLTNFFAEKWGEMIWGQAAYARFKHKDGIPNTDGAEKNIGFWEKQRVVSLFVKILFFEPAFFQI